MPIDRGAVPPAGTPALSETPPLAWVLRMAWETAVLGGIGESWDDWLRRELVDDAEGPSARCSLVGAHLLEPGIAVEPDVALGAPRIRLVAADAEALLPDVVVELLASLHRELARLGADPAYYDRLVGDATLTALLRPPTGSRATAAIPAWAVAPLAARAAMQQHRWLPRTLDSAERFAAPPSIARPRPLEVSLESLADALAEIALVRARLGWPSDIDRDAELLTTGTKTASA